MAHFRENARRAGLVAAAALGGVAALALAAMAILPLVIPGAELKRVAAQALAGSTGQRILITGEPSLSLLPSPRVVLGKVSFPLPAGQTLDAENVVARLNLWHLLSGRVDIAAVAVERPTLVLTGEGATPALALAPLIAAADRDRPELRIVDGTIVWRSGGGLTRELVSGIDASLDRIMGGSGIALAADFDWRDARVTTTLIMDDASALMSGTPTPTRIVIVTDGAKARLRGRAAFGNTLLFQGDVSAEGDSLRDLLDWMGTPVPTPGGFGTFGLVSRLSVENGTVSFTEATLDLDSNRCDGGLLVSFARGRPVVQGTFAADGLNLTLYGGLHLTSDDRRSWDRSPLDVTLLDAFDLDLRLSAASVVADQTTFSTVAASAVLTGGRLVLALGEAQVWGGALRASLTLAPGTGDAATSPAPTRASARASGAQVRLEAEATDVDLTHMLDEVAAMRRIEGMGTLQVDVAGAGWSVFDIAHTLSGTASLSATNGYLIGMDVAQMLHRIERRPLSAGNDARGGRTGFGEVSSRIVITNGVGTVEEMRLDGKQVRLAMEGSISIAGRELDLSGRASLVAPPSAKGTEAVDLPFSVRGAWDNPTILADPLSLIERSGAAQSLIEAVKSRAGANPPLPAN